MRRLIAIALIAAIVMTTAIALIAQRLTLSDSPDWTYLPCSAWTDTQYPDIPEFTYTDRCISDNGTIEYAH